ncbi:hypothetical protein KP509_32G072300 [Ceratopteris richardii]|nr:hypothetical protein KP509_32G072300 [Ceratopteris richardii]
MAKVKVSFQEKAENCLDKKRPSMQTRRQSIEVSSLEVEPPLVKGKNAPYVQPIREKHARALGSFSSHAVSPSSRCFPSLSGRLEAFFQSHLPDILIKLRDAICCRWGKDEMAVDQHSLTEGHRLPDTNMDDLNEMKALLNTINQNLIMLENRGKAHPQLLSSKLAPVYFTT